MAIETVCHARHYADNSWILAEALFRIGTMVGQPFQLTARP